MENIPKVKKYFSIERLYIEASIAKLGFMKLGSFWKYLLRENSI
jgi:hypothetical protein